MLVVNLFGAPGAGKSTGAAYVFSKLKMLGVNAELVTEFAKDKTWEDNQTALSNQSYVFGKQNYKMSRCKDKVDVIVTDSPLFLSVIYNNDDILGEDFNKVVLNVFNSYDNLNFFIRRVKPYNPIGRNQTEKESDEISKELKYILDKNDIPYHIKEGTEFGYEDILNEVVTYLTNKDISQDNQNKKYKVLALFGKSSAGKDTIQKWLVENNPNMKGIISCTTRPKRDYEQDGIDYHFITEKDFIDKEFNNELIEYTSFNGWLYGSPISSLDSNKINVGVFNPAGINTLLHDSRLEVIPVYIDCSDKIRLSRSMNREKNPDYKEICRRFLTDEEDFSNIKFDYITFDNKEDRDNYNCFLNILPKDFLIGQK